jgi:uncharacterized protein involved in outer membrane biogenesis
MKFLQDTIEKKLSQLLGRRVSFEQLNISPLSGQIDAEGMTVAGDEPNQPLLSVLRISAKIAMAKALAGQIVVKSLVIDGPTLNLIRRRDGSINIPRPGKRPITGGEDDKTDAWQLEAQSIRVSNGRITFHDLLTESGIVSADQINGEVTDLRERRATAELEGSADIAKWLAALPKAVVLPQALSSSKFNAPIEMRASLNIDLDHGIQIQKLDLKVQDVSIPLNRTSRPLGGQ